MARHRSLITSTMQTVQNRPAAVGSNHLVRRGTPALVPSEQRSFTSDLQNSPALDSVGVQLIEVAVVPLPLRDPQWLTPVVYSV